MFSLSPTFTCKYSIFMMLFLFCKCLKMINQSVVQSVMQNDNKKNIFVPSSGKFTLSSYWHKYNWRKNKIKVMAKHFPKKKKKLCQVKGSTCKSAVMMWHKWSIRHVYFNYYYSKCYLSCFSVVPISLPVHFSVNLWATCENT